MVGEEDMRGERDDGAPPVLREPQDERNAASNERNGALDDPSIRSPERATRGERPKRGGGPKTAAGKARVRLNAVRHGVLAETPVLPLVESEERWEELRRDVLDWFGLEGPFQQSLGTRAATLIWRLERAARAETEATRHYQQDVPDDWKSSMRMEGLSIPSFPQLHKKIKGTLPSGKLWEAYRTLFDVNSTLQRMVVLAPGTPRTAYDALSKAIERLNHDQEFAAEAVKTIEFVPDYPTDPDMSNKVRAMLQATPA